jgi:hypothetical protein
MRAYQTLSAHGGVEVVTIIEHFAAPEQIAEAVNVVARLILPPDEGGVHRRGRPELLLTRGYTADSTATAYRDNKENIFVLQSSSITDICTHGAPVSLDIG